jgi:hypothetical protein
MATDTSIESNISVLHLPHVPFSEIAGRLHVDETPISRAIRPFHPSGIVSDALRIGRPRMMQSNLVTFIETRQLRKPSISGVELRQEIKE